MPVFTTVAASIVASIGITGATATLIATSVISAGLAYVAGSLLGAFDTPSLDGIEGGNFEDPGVEQRLGARTTNKIPVLYGTWMERGRVSFFEVSEDRQKLYTIITLGEAASSINTIYIDEYKLTFNGVTGVITAAADIDGNTTTRFNSNINIRTYATGGRSTYLEGELDSWTADHKMTGLCYAVVTVTYNRDDDVTGLPDIRFVGTGKISNPALAAKDMLTNTIYGLGLDTDTFIDTASFTAAETYMDELVTYTDKDGNAAAAKRYQVNGSLSTTEDVKARITSILSGSSGSLRWDNGKYGLFLNKEESPVSFTFSEDNILGNISVSEVGFTNLVNKIDISYGRDENNNWQKNNAYLESPAAVKYPNEIDRVRTVSLPLVATNIEAERYGTLILNQARQQLVVQHKADATAMPLQSGDVVRYNDSDYGWDNKLFRIVKVAEMEINGALEYQIEAIEYADAVYNEGELNEIDVAPNAPIQSLDDILPVTDLEIDAIVQTDAVPYITLNWTVPSNSLIEEFDIFVNPTQNSFSSSDTYLIQTVKPTSGSSNFIAGASIDVDVTGLPAGSYNIWVVARNGFISSVESNTVALDNWNPEFTTGSSTRTIYRFHENFVDNDPGAPTGSDGTGGGWQEDSSDPHWEAVTTVPVTGEQKRELRFTVTGTPGQITFTDTDTEQSVQISLSGELGSEVTDPAKKSIATFTTSGSSAKTVGTNAEYNITVNSGESDPDGTSGSKSIFKYFPGTGTTSILFGTENPAITFNRQGVLRRLADFDSYGELSLMTFKNNVPDFADDNETDFTPTSFSQFEQLQNDLYLAVPINGGDDPDVDYLSALQNLDSNSKAYIFMVYDTDNWCLAQIDTSNPVTLIPNGTNPPQGSVQGIKLRKNLLRFFGAPTASVNVTIRTALSVDPTITDIGFFGNNNGIYDKDARILPESVYTNSSPGTPQEIFDEALAGISASTNINNIFDIDTEKPYVVDGIPRYGAIVFTSKENKDIDPAIATTNPHNDDDVDITQIGSPPGTISTIIRFNYDADWVPSSQSFDLQSKANATAIADFIESNISIDDATILRTGNTFNITYNDPGIQTAPTIAFAQGGTSSDPPNITVATVSEGGKLGTSTRVSVTDGISTEVLDLTSESDSDSSASQISTFMNTAFTDSFVSTVTNNVITSTSVNNNSNTLVVTITAGVNEPPSDPAPNDLASVKVITQEGQTNDSIRGQYTSFNVFEAGSSIGNVNSNDQSTLSLMANRIAALYNAGSNYTASVNNTTISLTSTFKGLTPLVSGVSLSIVNVGVDTDNNQVSFDFTRTVNEDGSVQIVNSGELTRYTITEGALAVDTGFISNGLDSEGATQELTSKLGQFANQYNHARSGTQITSTSIFNGREPDLSISFSGGLDTDNVPDTLDVSRVVVAQGDSGLADLTNAEWDYFVINQEIRIDTDLLNINNSNQISVNRGLILDSTTIEGFGSGTATSATTHTTGARDSILVIFGGCGVLGGFVDTDSSSVSVRLEYSTDGGTNWVTAFTSNSFNYVVGASSIFLGDTATPTLGVNGTIDADPNTTFMFRTIHLSSGQISNQSTNMGFSFVLLEELRA